MNFLLNFGLVVLFHSCALNQVNSLDYNELRNLTVSCYPLDSCHRRDYLATPVEETCECEATCYRRGTCCIDSPYVDPRPSTRTEVCSGERIIGVAHYYYFKNTGSYSFYQKNRCDLRWNGPIRVRQMCEMEEPVDGVDFMIAIPVTNTYSGISYKNYFCALCNNDIQDSVLWDVGIYEDDDQNLISNRFNVDAVTEDDSDNAGGRGSCAEGSTTPLVYNEEERFYGYWDYCSSDTPRFVSVTATLSIPEQLQSLVKGCRTNVISQCSPGWQDVRVRIVCGSYVGIIKGPPEENQYGIPYYQYFRNAHCALCNNVTNFEGFSCEPFSPGTVITTPTYPTSLTILFGHLLSNDGCLGENERFVQGLGCRAVVCANREYKVRNGKCTL